MRKASVASLVDGTEQNKNSWETRYDNRRLPPDQMSEACLEGSLLFIILMISWMYHQKRAHEDTHVTHT